MFNIIFKVRNVAIVLLSAFFFACDEPKDIGFDLTNNGSITPYYSDTIKINTSTVLSDSAINANQNFMLAGMATDPVFGKIKSTAYWQPTLATGADGFGSPVLVEFTKKDNAVVDSVRFRLYNTGLFIGDTLSKTEYSIFRLKKSLTSGKYYNYTESPEYESTPIVTFKVNTADFKNKGDTSIYHFIKLPLSIGEELLALANTDASKDRTKFNDAFKGFAIVPTSNAKAIYGFNVGPVGSGVCTLDLYFHSPSETVSTLYYFELSGPRFSGIVFDRAGTKVAGLKNGGDEISSILTSGQTFIQSGSGISTKIDLSNLKNLGSKYQVNKATLEFKLDSTYFNRLFFNNYYFTLAEVDNRNQQKRLSGFPSYLTTIGTGFGGSPGVMIDSTKTVTFDVTYFVHSLAQDKNKNHSLLILPATLTANQSALISNDNLRRSVLNKPKLKLYYSK